MQHMRSGSQQMNTLVLILMNVGTRRLISIRTGIRKTTIWKHIIFFGMML